MLMMIALAAMLGLVEVGYLYWAKRDTQKVADLAALAGAQQLSACNSGNTDNSAARGNATTENRFTGTLAINCGTWDPVANSGITDHFAATTGSNTPNAVKVVASRPVLPIFGSGALPTVNAEAVAMGLQPVAVFSVGSTLVNFSGAAPLGQLLAGIGINIPSASLVGYNGLATATITPSGLLNQLGVSVPTNITVGGLNQLLASSLNAHALIDVLNATVNAAGQQQLLSANASLVNAITTSLGTAPGTVTLGSTSSAPGGLFAQIVAPDSAAQTALNAKVNALQVIATAIGVGTGNHAVSVPYTSISLPPVNVTAAASVIEPPAIGVGGVGTTASTSQIRAFVYPQISTNSIPLIGTLLSALAKTTIKVDIPIALDLVNAQATLTGLCTTKDSSGNWQATIAVNSSVLKTCVGNFTKASAFSTQGTCDQIPGSSTPHQLLLIQAAGVTVANVNSNFVIGALPASGSATFSPGQTQNVPANGTPLAIGTTVSNLFNALTAVLVTQGGTSNSSNIVGSLANDLWNNNASAGTTGGNAGQLTAALNQLSSTTSGLQTFLNQVGTQTGGLLSSALTLNVVGLLNNTGGLLSSVTNLLGNILNQTTCTLGLLGSAPCINVIQTAMNGTSTGGTPNSVIALLAFVVQALQGPLNQIGTQILTPLLNNTLGVQLGVSTVTLHSLQCRGVQLVY
jgi:uncharacterized membrane protein